MKKRYILPTIILLVLAVGLFFGYKLIVDQPPEETENVKLSNKKASDDFTDLFRLTDSRGDALAELTVTKVEQVSEVIEKYEVSDTLYTKITATVHRDFAERITGEITIYLLGNAENFPNREVLKVDNRYILRLESWSHESGVVYLLNPLESTYLRVHNGMVLVRESAALPNYQPALSPDAFAKSFADYRTEHPFDDTKLFAHYDDILATVEKYDYNNKELAYRPDEAAIAKRLQLARQLAE
ncbi:MAG: hypothetical protein IJN42_05920 [Clostridia bacterium]|nr:hypothetical protein [Clostridia bacterium]